jgi:hypothetical protein
MPTNKNPAKLAVAVLGGIYFLWCAYRPFQWRFIDNVNLIIHEAGHVVFMFGGEFLAIAGGSLFQVIVPAVFVGYFYREGKPYSAALVLFWVGHSMLNVSVYASDAQAMALPLLGGEGVIHDWNYLLSELGWLKLTSRIANAIRFVATLVICAGCFFAVRESLRESPPEDDYERAFTINNPSPPFE